MEGVEKLFSKLNLKVENTYSWKSLVEHKKTIYDRLNDIRSVDGLAKGCVWVIDRYQKQMSCFSDRSSDKARKYGGRDDPIQSFEELQNVLELRKGAKLFSSDDQYMVYVAGQISERYLEMLRV